MVRLSERSRANANYMGVSLATTLHMRIEKVRKVLGYASKSAFVDRAVRNLLEHEEARYLLELNRLQRLEQAKDDVTDATIREESDY